MPTDGSSLLIAAAIAFLRIGGMFAFLPLPGIQNAPVMVRVLGALAITVAVAPAWAHISVSEVRLSSMTAVIFSEAAIGLTLGVAVQLMTDLFSAAGQLINMQTGFTYATTIDPSSQTDSGVISLLWQLFGGFLLIAFGIDRYVLKAIGSSFDICPPGAWIATPQNAAVLFRYGSQMFALACRIALPVIAALILLDLMLAAVTRVSAQVQLLSLTFPLKILASLLLIAVGLRVAVFVFKEGMTVFVAQLPQLLRNAQ